MEFGPCSNFLRTTYKSSERPNFPDVDSGIACNDYSLSNGLSLHMQERWN